MWQLSLREAQTLGAENKDGRFMMQVAGVWLRETHRAVSPHISVVTFKIWIPATCRVRVKAEELVIWSSQVTWELKRLGYLI